MDRNCLPLPETAYPMICGEITLNHFIESPCASGPCRNGGRCRQQAASFRCSCRPGYKGNICEIKGIEIYMFRKLYRPRYVCI